MGGEVHWHVALVEEIKAVRVSMLREVRDGISVLTVYQAWKCAGPSGAGKKWPNTCCGKLKRNGRPNAWGIWFGGEGDDEYRFSNMMRADSYWIFSEGKIPIVVKDLIGWLVDLEMDPKT